MLTDDELVALFHDLESDRVERKRDYRSNADRIRQAICAFANDLPDRRLPGVVFVGQNDDGTCAGIDVGDELLKTLGGLRSDGQILPFPVMSVARKEIDGCAVAVIEVAPSMQPPVRVDGRTWIRVGPRRGTATPEEERRLAEKQTWHNLSFDARPCLDASLEDLDLVRFEAEYVPSATSPESRRQNGRSTGDKLRALRLLSREGRPVNAAILLLGRDPRAFFPGAYIQFLRLDGSSLTDPIIDQKEIGGTVPDQVRQIEELMRLNVRITATIGGSQRREQPDYPLEALEQIVRNALLHRTYDQSTMPVKVYWYSDRVEVINPGGLFGEVTPETIWKNATAYRNPLLAEGLKSLGVVERFGYGLARAERTLSENGNPSLGYQFEPNYTLFKVEPAQ
ncbi:ATP-binding protein [Rhodoplanes serenus]|uniref:ATP-binding protein n=1 Tax=Rhodoplanes serenus TaxID=200615 RepID=UPI000DAE1E62|nr:ATP-binding protein [Rhodoplanes serenus]RAI35590.1 transcriptional regulator [Rhodoplanes serenus]